MSMDLTGRVFGRLTVIGAGGRDKGGRPAWLCRCECGGQRTVRGSSLTTGNTKSCGCAIPEQMAEVGRRNGAHRQSRTLEYQSWGAMLRRCYDQSNNRYQYYGALGVRVCDRWRDSFEAFLADMGPRPTPEHSIDRFPDKNGNYEPGNCRWATPSEQNSNRRPFKPRPREGTTVHGS